MDETQQQMVLEKTMLLEVHLVFLLILHCMRNGQDVHLMQ